MCETAQPPICQYSFQLENSSLTFPNCQPFKEQRTYDLNFPLNKTHGTDQSYGELGNPDAILVLRKVEAAPNRAQETLKGNETQRKVFSPPSPLCIGLPAAVEGVGAFEKGGSICRRS